MTNRPHDANEETLAAVLPWRAPEPGRRLAAAVERELTEEDLLRADAEFDRLTLAFAARRSSVPIEVLLSRLD